MSGLADTDVNASKPSTASAHEPHCAPHALPAKPRSSARESAAADGSAKPSRIAIADALLRSSHASQQVWSGLVWSRCGAVALWALSTGRRSSVCTAAHQRKSATLVADGSSCTHSRLHAATLELPRRNRFRWDCSSAAGTCRAGSFRARR